MKIEISVCVLREIAVMNSENVKIIDKFDIFERFQNSFE